MSLLHIAIYENECSLLWLSVMCYIVWYSPHRNFSYLTPALADRIIGTYSVCLCDDADTKCALSAPTCDVGRACNCG